MITVLFSISAFYVGFRFHAWYASNGGDYADFFGAVGAAANRFRASRSTPEEDDDNIGEG